MSKALSVDIGGGVFMAVGADGTIPAPTGSVFDFSGNLLPGVSALRLRLEEAALPADIGAVSLVIATMPSNVTLRFGKLPPFFARTGELAVPTITPDITSALQRAQTEAPVIDGFHDIKLTVHSGTLGRLAITIDVSYLGTAPLMAAGPREIMLPFDFASVTTTAASALRAIVPAGAVIQSPKTQLAVRGAFDATRVAFGPTGPTPILAALALRCSADATLAQKLVVPADTTVTALDLFVAAEGPAARLALDLRADADGRPGPGSLLASPVNADITGDASGQPHWVSVALKTPALLPKDATCWLVAQAIDGAASLGVAEAADAALVPLRSADAGFSWRHAGGSAPLLVRLRVLPDRFHMPIDFFAGSGPAARRVSLAAYDPLGKIDTVLDRPEIAGTLQDYLALAAPPPCQDREVLRNPDFSAWTAVGDTLGDPQTLAVPATGGIVLIDTLFDRPSARLAAELHEPPAALAFSADGTRLFVALGDGITVVDTDSGASRPLALSAPLTPRGLAVSSNGDSLFTVSGTQVFSVGPASGLVAPIPVPVSATAAALSADGASLYVAGAQDVVAIDLRTRLPSWRAAAAAPAAVAVSPDGASLAILDVPAGMTPRLVTFDAKDGLQSWSAPMPKGLRPRALAYSADGLRLDVVADGAPGTVQPPLTLVSFDPRGRQLAVLPLGIGAAAAISIAVTPVGDRIYVAGGALALDPADGRLAAGGNGQSIAAIPVGARHPAAWTVTVGQADPEPDNTGDTRHVAALLTDGAMSQVRAVAGGCQHVLTVAAIVPDATFRRTGTGPVDAAVELFWYDGAGVLLRTDAVTLPPSAIIVTQHRRLTPPTGSAQVEVRVSVAGGVCGLELVSLRSTDALLDDDAWHADPASTGRFTDETGALGRILRNPGAEDAALLQSVALSSLAPLELAFTGTVLAGTPAFGVRFVDASGVAAGPDTTVMLEAASFARRQAMLVPPAGVVAAEIRVTLPGGAALRVERLRLRPRPATAVPCGFIAQSPGVLHVTNARIVYDIVPGAAPAPPGGLVPPTPPGGTPGAGGGDCCCPDQSAPQRQLPPRVRPVMRAVLPMPAPSPAPPIAPPVLTDITGIGPARMRKLAAAGIATTRDLAVATPAAVVNAIAGGIAPEFAVAMIRQARAMLGMPGNGPP